MLIQKIDYSSFKWKEFNDLIEFKVCNRNKPKFSHFFPEMSLGSAFLTLMAHRSTTVQALNGHTVLETVRMELLDPHMAAVTRVICEAQWQAADIKVFISFPQFTIYSA